MRVCRLDAWAGGRRDTPTIRERITATTRWGPQMITSLRARALKCAWTRALIVVGVLTGGALTVTSGQDLSRYHQSKFTHGQNIAPAFEGWEENPDGSFNMVFGYFNRNWEEQPLVPIGPNNNVEPGGPDRAQPTHFFPRRNKFVFRVPVPKDF